MIYYYCKIQQDNSKSYGCILANFLEELVLGLGAIGQILRPIWVWIREFVTGLLSLCQGVVFLLLFVCLFVCQQDNTKGIDRFSQNCLERLALGVETIDQILGAIWIQIWIQEFFKGFVINARQDLAEVCTLGVLSCFTCVCYYQ